VGGKGANLGEMTRAGLPVPPGFCITTEVYRDFARDLSMEGMSGAEIRETFRSRSLPGYLTDMLNAALDSFPANTLFSVRSSATAEDLPFASFAGQQDTYLNVPAKELPTAIRNCFASLFTDRAIEYRKQNNIKQAMMAVVVQQMVRAESSGIMFTADPLTGIRHRTMIEASWGLGEALVSGLVSPDQYVHDQRRKCIDEKKIATKRTVIRPLEGGGTEQVDICSDEQVLNDRQIMELASLAQRLETHYGSPQDVEWAIENEQIYLLQTRAITSLYPVPKEDAEGYHIYFCANHIQMYTDPAPILALETISLLFRFQDVPLTEYSQPWLYFPGGRIFIDISRLCAHPFIRRVLLKVVKEAEPLTASALKEVLQRKPTFPSYSRLRIPKGLLKLPFSLIKRTLQEEISKTIADADKMVAKEEAKVQAIMKASSGIAKLEAIYQNLPWLDNALNFTVPTLGPAVIAMKMMERTERKLFKEALYTPYIQTGLEGNITTEMGLKIGDLADLAIEENLLPKLQSQNFSVLAARFASGKDRFSRAYQEFMSVYGCRCTGEVDISRPRWDEEPGLILRQIMTLASTKKPQDHRAAYAETVAHAKKQAEAFIAAVKERKGPRAAKRIAKWIQIYRDAMPAREHSKYIMVRELSAARKVLLDEGATLVRQGNLSAAEDVFHLSYAELYDAISNGSDMRKLVSERKELFNHYRKLTPPRILTSEGEYLLGSYETRNVPEGALPGEPVSAGIVEGIAKIVIDPSSAEVREGEILIAPFTDPGWTPLFVNAVAVVTEMGGKLTHGAVVAREYGIPAVVGVLDVTKKIKSGQRIRVDGYTGYVLPLD